MKPLFLLFFSLTLSLYGQDHFEYTNREHFKGTGVVFTANYRVPIYLPKKIKQFTPAKEQIDLAERVLNERYNIDDSLNNETKPFKNVFWRYNRQYVGLLDTSTGEHYISVSLMNFKRRRIAESHFEGWRENYVVGFGDYYEKNTRTYLVNLNTQKTYRFTFGR